MSSVFNKANRVEAPKTAAAKKSAAEEVTFQNLEAFAAMDMVSKAIETVQATLGSTIKNDLVDTFIGMGMQLKKRPANIKGIEGAAQASMQLKTLSTRSTISTENVARLTEAGIPLLEVEEVATTFVMNPKYSTDEALMEKVATALEGIVPEDFFLFQERKKYVVDGDNTMNALFNLKNRALVAELLPLVATTAIKPTTAMSLKESMDTVLEFLGDVSDAVEA